MTLPLDQLAEHLRERLPDDGELIVATEPDGWEVEWYTGNGSRNFTARGVSLGETLTAVLEHDVAVTGEPGPTPEASEQVEDSNDRWYHVPYDPEPHALCCADCKARLAEAERKLTIDPVDVVVEAIRQSAKDRPPREGTLLRFRRYAAAAIKELERHGVGLTPAEQKALLDASRAVDLGDEREQAALEAGQAKLRKSLAPADEEGELEAAG